MANAALLPPEADDVFSITQHVRKSHGGAEDPTWAAVRKILHSALADADQIKNDAGLTRIGKQKHIRTRFGKALQGALPFRQKIAQLDARLSEIRGVVRGGKERTTDDLLQEQEIRAQIRAKYPPVNVGGQMVADHTAIGMAYIEAIKRGDEGFVRAVESSPQAFPLVSAETLAEGLELRVAKSPYGDEAERIAAEREAIGTAVANLERELGQAAFKLGIAEEIAPEE